jgi:hypothetical protein
MPNLEAVHTEDCHELLDTHSLSFGCRAMPKILETLRIERSNNLEALSLELGATRQHLCLAVGTLKIKPAL